MALVKEEPISDIKPRVEFVEFADLPPLRATSIDKTLLMANNRRRSYVYIGQKTIVYYEEV